jgi:hypothetical protein
MFKVKLFFLLYREGFKKAVASDESQEMKEMRLKLKELETINSKLKLKDEEIVLPIVYHIPGSRSTRVVWLFEELGVPYKSINVVKEKGFTWLKKEE